MIGFVEGKIASKKPTEVLVNVNGIGYKVRIAVTVFDELPAAGENILLHTYLSVREDALELFGFLHDSDRELFKLLISVNGIGPKLAQSILSGIRGSELQSAISEGNISRIVAIPGIGKKTAERLVVELKDKIEKTIDTEIDYSVGGSAKSDAIAALVSLGYSLKNAEKTVLSIMESNSDISIEELIKESLAKLNK
ncbi:MAG: Holliday junction ATP-dependent DNA helicase RuvA [Melioribacteraceae bacterium]|nr:MAG: Holliday junction ATP-dependent DNA helicase RuvA [Melioribacteraceae bacterium]